MTRSTNQGKTMIVLFTILTLAVGVMISTTTISQQQVMSAQNMTTGDNNLTGDSIENMTAGAAAAEMDQTGSISSAEEGDPIPDIDVKLGKCPKCPNGYPKPK